MALRKFNAYEFTVEGEGQFPVDMLRYDNAVPRTSEDVVVAFGRRGKRQVTLVHTAASHSPADERPVAFVRRRLARGAGQRARPA